MKEFLLDLIKKINLKVITQHIRVNYPEKYEEIINLTSFLSDTSTFTERMYCIINDIKEMPKCKLDNCNNKVKFKNITFGHFTYCCVNHSLKDVNFKIKVRETWKNKSKDELKDVYERREKTIIEKYGSKDYINQRISEGHHNKSEESKKSHSDKIKEIWKNKSEDEMIIKDIKQKQTKLEKYGNENFNNRLKMKQTKLEKYGNENYRDIEKMKQTKLEKYGNENFNNRLKMKQTKLEKYGNENYVNKEKQKKTLNEFTKEKWNDINIKKKKIKLERYGNENYTNKEKAKQTKLEKYGDENYTNKEKAKQTVFVKFFNHLINSDRLKDRVTPLFNIEDYKGNKNNYKWKCNRCNNDFETNIYNGKIPRCPVCYPLIGLGGVSFLEKEMQDWIEKYKETEKNKRFYFVSNHFYELDIFIPSLNIGIEFNGLYWHSELNGKNRNYHIDKTNYFKENGIKILHIYEDEWMDKQNIVKSIILNKIGKTENKIFARKCKIKEVNLEDSINFLNDNHIQGGVNSNINIGLYLGDELVSLINFGKSRFNKNYNWELLRFCNKINTNVVGGFSRLLKYFRDKYIGSIITYADLRYSTGDLYRNSGFNQLGQNPPNFYYLKNQIRYYHMNFQKHKLKDKLEIFDETLTEWENMQLNNYDRIWDCGTLSFELK